MREKIGTLGSVQECGRSNVGWCLLHKKAVTDLVAFSLEIAIFI